MGAYNQGEMKSVLVELRTGNSDHEGVVVGVKVSVVTVTWNCADTLGDCLDSVARQSWLDREHVVIDGGSTDGTLALLDARRDQLGVLVSEPDKGMYDALNKGIAKSSGDVVGLLHADDCYADETVLAKVAALFADPEMDACYGDLEYVAAQDMARVVRYWQSGAYNADKFYWGWMPPHPTFFVRRRVYEQLGGFNLEMGTAADYELMLRLLLKHRVRTAYIPKVLVKMRVGGMSNATLKNRLAANRMDRKAWRVNGLRPYPWTLAMKPLRKVGQWIFREK
ncbi:MAG: glycosyltransferase family 2 protein [Desulfuromonadaceae bacterium]|nr:glycosyltransferase family 2 protein [Desulfuromonadaceae bacterium]